MARKTQIAAVDAGNGGVNAVLHRTRGKPLQHYEPSVRAAATGDSLGLGEGFELQYTYVDWNGNRYVTGDDVTRITKRALERHIGKDRYGNEFHQFLVANALAKLGVKEGQVDLTLFAPPGMFVAARETMRQHFGSGPVEITLKDDKQPRKWTYSKVTVWPEGLGAAACFALDADGKPTGRDDLSEETVVLDAGVFTLDALQLSNGDFNPENLGHATWDNGGVDAHIRQPVLRTLHKQDNDLTVLTVDDIDRLIRQGAISGDYTLRIAGLEIDAEPLIEKARERYAEWISNNIIDGVFNGLRGIKAVILVGGGAVLIEDHLRGWYGDKIMDRNKNAATRGLHPVDMNAIGGLRLALMNPGK